MRRTTELFFQTIVFFFKLVGTHSSIVYKQASEKIEQFTELFGYALLATGMTLTALPLCYAIVNFYVLGSGKESFFLFFPTWFVLYNQMMHLKVEREVQNFLVLFLQFLRWPFDWKTPLGYLVAWSGEFAGFEAGVIIAVPCFNIIFGSSWLFIIIADDITNGVAAFNNSVKILVKDKLNERVQLMKRFCDITRNYSDTKQCVMADFHLNLF